MIPGEQFSKQDKAPQLAPYRFKKGVSGNPSGRPEGRKSMKTWAKEYLEALPEDERIDFINSQSGGLIWQMAEGGPTAKVEATIDTNSQYTPDEIEAAKKLIANRLNTTSDRTTEQSE